MPGLDDFDRYVDEHGIPSEHYAAAFALWIAEVSGGPAPRRAGEHVVPLNDLVESDPVHESSEAESEQDAGPS